MARIAVGGFQHETNTLAPQRAPPGPNDNSVVAPVPSCVGRDNPPHYEPTTYGDFTSVSHAQLRPPPGGPPDTG